MFTMTRNSIIKRSSYLLGPM